MIHALIKLSLLLFPFSLSAISEEEDFVYDLSLATQGVMVSQFNTGVNYYLGRGIYPDLEKAVYWYQEASEQGHSKAPFNIAIMYAQGEGLENNFTFFREYMVLASERGNSRAKGLLNLIINDYQDNPEDFFEENCCIKGFSHAMAESKK
jgi:TPR repeat protein|tara:strand:+ start:448 stop:897 length:450 start_codon:yes stop_codon:yes gene_type:complete